jgi:hypothetical protein
MEPIVNRVAQSSLITIKLEEFFPQEELVHFDLKDFLFKELILKEKDFRAALKEHDWEQYTGKVLLAYCSTDAIIPVWAYMLVAAYAAPIAKEVFQGTAEVYYQVHFDRAVAALDMEQYTDQRIVVKGCSDHPVPPSAYLDLTSRLRPVAKSIMYGEPCSTVPVYKKKIRR